MSKALYNVIKLNYIGNVCQYGAKGDDSTDNREAFLSTINNFNVVYVPEGVYVIDRATNASCIPVDKNVTIVGAGRSLTTLKFIIPDNTYTNIFQLAAKLELHNVRVEVINLSGASISIFAGSSLSGLLIKNCHINGGVTNVGSVVSYTAYGINIPNTGTHEDISIVDSEFERFHWVLLKTNSATSTQRRIKLINNTFRRCYRTPASFNSPLGTMDDIIVEGNTFTEHLGPSASLTNYFYVACSETSRLKIINNIFEGSPVAAIHLEEGPTGAIVANNIIDVDTIGISLIDNSNSGSPGWAEDVHIHHNIIRNTGTVKTAGTRGIRINNSPDGYPTGQKVRVNSNYIYGFEWGISSGHSAPDYVTIANNEVNNCSEGFRLAGAMATISFNKSINCDVGVSIVAGGCATGHIFIGCTLAAQSGGRWVNLVNPRFEFSPISMLSNGFGNFSTTIPLSSSIRFIGTATIYATSDTSTASGWQVFDVGWNSTTLTVTSKQVRVLNFVSFNFVSVSGALYAQIINNATAKSSVRTAVQFNGDIIIG